ncbi:SMC5-SMC6 complex localization factor protein 1 isoform X1 [Anolis sagrei]|uniref:SMC5-SMC6 complex localization factor protein 1 isoform X1 n=1 Tax=Anolis sagrei TaxID=38937 RepID=UPI0035215386
MENGMLQPRIIQLTGFKNQEKKILVELILKLESIFHDTEEYRNCTHLIAKQPCKSEKFLAACAAGKWILTKDYIINSAESGRWLDETTYEWGYKIEKGSHYSPQMQSAPKRWREELTCSGAAGAFHRWKVLLVMRGDKQKDSLIRVLEAGKATIHAAISSPKNITHVLTNNATLNQESEKVFGAPCYPVRYLETYLLKNEIRYDLEKYQENSLQKEHEFKEIMTDIHCAKMRSEIIKHIYFQPAMLSKYTQIDQMNGCRKEVKNTRYSRRENGIIEELVDDQLFPIAVTEFLSGRDPIPPAKFLHSLLGHLLQGNSDPALSAQFFHILYTLLQHAPPWKSPSMLRYYLEVLQCPVSMKGTWPLMETLVRSCLYCKSIFHSVPVSETMNEEKTFHKSLLRFFLNLFQAEVLTLTRSLYEGVDSQHLQTMPETVLQKTFWLGSESMLLTKQINILVDWITNSCKEKFKTNNIFKHEVVELLNGILSTVVEYWILSGFMMDRNMLPPVADDLASYIAISCDDFSAEELKAFVSSIPSLWLEMFVAEAFFKRLYFETSTVISTEPLSLQKIVCSYLPALQIWMRETGKLQKGKREKIGQWPCPESQRALLMLNGDKQNQAEVLPDVPVQTRRNSSPPPKKLKTKTEIQASHGKRNDQSSPKQMNIYKVNVKGETALHITCKSNNVKKLIHLLSLPGIDINVKDYAGWTPLHEACNHGSTVCVREILQHCPEVNLFSQVDGVTPLHDALTNGHIEIAELLLQHGGLVLLEQKDSEGNLPLDHIKCVTTKQHLLNVAKSKETVEEFHARVESSWYSQQTEFWTALFCKMLLNFCSVYNLFRPFSVSFKKSTCSKPFLVTAGCCKFNTSHWLIDLYLRELHTYQNLPNYLQETIEKLKHGPGEQKKAFVVALQQISWTAQMSNLNLTNGVTK